MTDHTTLFTYLADASARYDADLSLLGTRWKGPGYHSLVPAGEWVHPTRDSLEYALALLIEGSPANVEQAQAIIWRTLSLQDTDPTSPTYGIWSWLYEEPLEAMAPPDWNWADFLGALLCHIWIEHRDRISDKLADDVRVGLRHAAWSIFRRNVQPDYTNIAVMGAAVTGIVGDALDEPHLLFYARQRLNNVLSFVRSNGGLTEYNSPTYTPVALFEIERILQLSQDDPLCETAEALRQIVWETIATHYHPGTAQWAGPHSRTYADYINGFVAAQIAQRTGVPIPLHPRADQSVSHFSAVDSIPCPVEWVPHFDRLPQETVFARTSFTRAQTVRNRQYRDVVGTTWMVVDATLASINYDSLWTQRRPLLAYWRTADDPAVVLRARFLRDGQDFASAGIMNAQDHSRLLSMFSFVADMGDFHISLDKPSDGLFHAQDLRVRYELTGTGVSGQQLDDATYELRAGDWRAVIHTAPAQYDGQPVRWRLDQSDGQVTLDAILYSGDTLPLMLSDRATFKLAVGLELLPLDRPIYPESPILKTTADQVQALWVGTGLQLHAPIGLLPRA